MQVLIVKTSSMGDVLHTLPALTDALRAIPSIQFDWIVEPGFAEIPRWHPAVRDIFPAPIRRWRKQFWHNFKQGKIQQFITEIRQTNYDLVIDAQGLIKSALITGFTRGKKVGFDFASVREKIASVIYQKRYLVLKNQHAVERVRQLFAKALNYDLPILPPDYGIDKNRLQPTDFGENYLLFLHGTTWDTKHWPEDYWQELASVAAKHYKVLLPWGSEVERLRAERICQKVKEDNSSTVEVLPKLSLSQIASAIAKAKGIVAVDTGLGHVAAAMGIPTVSLYGPTDPKLTGAYGPSQLHLETDFSCAPCLSRVCKKEGQLDVTPPCFKNLSSQRVWQILLRHIHESMG